MKTILYLSIISLLFSVSCKESTSLVADTSDYEVYLNSNPDTELKLANENRMFWKTKLEATPRQYPYLVQLASSETDLFHKTGAVEHLITSEKYLKELIDNTAVQNAGQLRALAHNYISQHKFNEALEVLKSAEENGEKLKYTQMMMFDVHLELGNSKEAYAYLEKIKDLSNFDYLIRLSKWSDHKGQLVEAIRYMEKALAKAEIKNNKELKKWAYTNIADFYGHNGEIKKSYDHFLKALALDPNDAYAKKGIAWIVYSHDRNPSEALRILESVEKYHKSPDYFLLKAEIAEYMGENSKKEKYINDFMTEVNKPAYGAMYTRNIIKLYADELNTPSLAISLAKEETKVRPTAEAYDLLAWAYFKNGEINKALNISERYVVSKTSEPEVLYHLAEIYKASGKTSEETKELKSELLASVYELGPVLEKQIEAL